MNWLHFAFGFGAGCAYCSTITFIRAYLDRRAELHRQDRGR
ncbi:hypothetical protein [Achromobacter xylosoxidans]|nr:hypothetical protein [Achromobacter xylosoxidans]